MPPMAQTSSRRVTLTPPYTPLTPYFTSTSFMPPIRRMSGTPRASPQSSLTFGVLPSPPITALANTNTRNVPLIEFGDEYFSTWRGRKLRIPGPLSWPCDSLELERLEAQHWLLKLLLGVPFIGPVGQVLHDAGTKGRVLDVATGVGVWAMDVAEMFPWVEVVGCDNAPIQEPDAWENNEWDIVDLDNLPYEDEAFDVVHVRFAKLRVRSYSRLLNSAWQLVRPGGLLLIFDAISPPTLHDGTSTIGTQAWTDAFHRSLRHAGMRPFNIDEIIKIFRNEQLVGSDMRVPIGHGTGRMGQLGKIHVTNTKAYLDAGRYVMIQHGGYTDAEVDVLSVFSGGVDYEYYNADIAAAAYLQDVREHPLYTKYHAFSVRKIS